jgi:hypothetical protein
MGRECSMHVTNAKWLHFVWKSCMKTRDLGVNGKLGIW